MKKNHSSLGTVFRSLVVAALLLFAGVLSFPLHAQGWTNPMTLPGLGQRSLGDPYMMKYRGYYYLYVSSGDRNIYCWRSKDLATWSEAYICCTDETTSGAYAPEVIYWNGLFYMCTSPRGTGHYLLTSDSPLGPFVHRTGNLGRDIDGSMFVNDDGKLYFYHANNEGIRGCTMSTDLSFGGDVDLGCRISGQWTEGPCVFKRNGLFYMLYTGNHVWTDGYRIDYAISNNGPLAGFRPQSDQNPILIDTETPAHKALGHGTAFVGPDLDTYFFCYHNLQDNKSRRLLNFERIGWNGDKLMMTGPTDWEQDKPLAATCDYFEREDTGSDWTMPFGGRWQLVDGDHMSQSSAEGSLLAIFTPRSYDSYTAEFTVRAAGSSEGSVGAVFSYQDENNYSEALINVSTNALEVVNHVDGAVKTSRSYSLPEGFDATVWHAIRIEKNEKRVRIYVDGMRKCQVSMQETGGQVGYATHDSQADFSYIAVSPYVDGSGMLDVSLPVPGMLPANLCTEKTDDVKTSSYTMTVGTSTYLRCVAGSCLKYRINVQRDNVYNIGLRYRSSAVSHVRVLVDGETVADNVELPSSRSTIVVETLKDVPLPGGHHELAFEIVDGSPYLYEYLVKRGVKSPHVMADNFDNGFSEEWGYREGAWNIVDGQLESTGRYGKMLMGGFEDIHLTDYTVECDVIYTSGAMNGGLLFRTTNASTGGADDSPVLGTDFLQGYIFFAGASSVALGKHNYGWQTLATASKEVDTSVPHHLKVEVEGATMRCYMDDMENPLITYTDPKPFITGRAGFRTHDSVIRFDNFVVTPAKNDDTAVEPLAADGRAETPTELRLYDLQGRQVSPADGSLRGIYIQRKNGESRKVVR